MSGSPSLRLCCPTKTNAADENWLLALATWDKVAPLPGSPALLPTKPALSKPHYYIQLTFSLWLHCHQGLN